MIWHWSTYCPVVVLRILAANYFYRWLQYRYPLCSGERSGTACLCSVIEASVLGFARSSVILAVEISENVAMFSVAFHEQHDEHEQTQRTIYELVLCRKKVEVCARLHFDSYSVPKNENMLSVKMLTRIITDARADAGLDGKRESSSVRPVENSVPQQLFLVRRVCRISAWIDDQPSCALRSSSRPYAGHPVVVDTADGRCHFVCAE